MCEFVCRKLDVCVCVSLCQMYVVSCGLNTLSIEEQCEAPRHEEATSR